MLKRLTATLDTVECGGCEETGKLGGLLIFKTWQIMEFLVTF